MEYFAFQWHITDECDQRCKHCYIFAEDACKQLDAMTWPQMQDTFYNCLDFCEVYHRLPYFYITGGDPILHPSFWDLLGLMKEHHIPFTILGNPFHLNDEVCRRPAGSDLCCQSGPGGQCAAGTDQAGQLPSPDGHSIQLCLQGAAQHRR